MENNYNICITCLSTDRHLVSLHKITHLQELKFLELKTLSGAICWECRSIIIKFHKFKRKALKAQATLYANMKIEDIKPLTYLGPKVNTSFDYQYYYNSDPLVNTDIEPKLENNTLKEESCDTKDYNEDIASDIDQKETEETEFVFIDAVSNKKAVKRDEIDEKEIEYKFIKVIFSEEEMIKNREDKRNHHNFKKIPFKCDSCVLGFTRKETYEIHIEKKHGQHSGLFECDVCKVRFNSKSAVNSHRMKHYICYRCRLCKYVTTELWSALNHCKLKHERDEPNNIHCRQCETVVKSPRELEDHVQTSHILYCNECGIKFKGKDTLRRHKARIHAVKREFICDVCTKSFMSRSRLESHLVSHSGNMARKLAYCHQCGIQYKNIYVYRNHLKNSANHSEKTYSCPACNKKFASKVYWTKHYNFYHLNKSQYKCENCNKLFISDWRLKNHKQKHHGLSRPRDHPCNICGKKFFTISILRNHQLTHSEERNYMCEDCGDTFKQRPALYTHARLVHGDGQKK